jgi:Ni,Fe-hydrogenase III large subunit
MNTMCAEETIDKFCRVVKPIRDKAGRIRFNEMARMINEVENLGRRMYLVRFDDGSTTFLFPDEIGFE